MNLFAKQQLARYYTFINFFSINLFSFLDVVKKRSM